MPNTQIALDLYSIRVWHKSLSNVFKIIEFKKTFKIVKIDLDYLQFNLNFMSPQ